MVFVYTEWERFCKSLADNNIHSIPAMSVNKSTEKYLVLKHDVETDVSKALVLARIENKYGHKGSFYVQAYLLDNERNVSMLREIQEMGHEVSYHHDVMDSCGGDLELAAKEFEKNRNKFADNGFDIITVCQHGNPIINRIGYTSNRDFFRSDSVRQQYPFISDIMVNFKELRQTEYAYYSDAGHHFKLIYDPLNNDIVDSDDKNIPYKGLDALFEVLSDGNCIISTHPHRWMKSRVLYVLRVAFFKIVKKTVKLVSKIPFIKKILSRYYYLAKKI
ncbi:MAG: hypothetical protein J6U86_00345 [Clostridia bacterium]|nr:hypothetical protein [Clostridia bacterium]